MGSAGVVPAHTFSSVVHTRANVPVFATGFGSEYVEGVIDNTDIAWLLSQDAPAP